MKIKKLELKKEIVANLSDKESKQVKGGATGEGATFCSPISCPVITCVYDCTLGTNPCYA